jgi:hypothetical protein
MTMAEIDVLLSAALKRISPPSDSAGVADAIRGRVAAGEVGVPAASSGFGAAAVSWLPWVGLIVVAGLIGGAGGAAGIAGHPRHEVVVAGASSALTQHAAALQCVDGPVVAQLPAGERVIALQRSTDSSWVGVRNPITLRDTVWLPAGAVTVDSGEASIATLPEGGACPEASVRVDAPVVAAPVAPPSGGGGGPAPAPDTTAPTLGKPTSSIDPVCAKTGSGPTTATISVSASDDVGVAGVSISWSGAESGSASMSGGGSSWSYNYTPTTGTGHGPLTFTVRASDGAGNQSNSNSVTITQAGCVG